MCKDAEGQRYLGLTADMDADLFFMVEISLSDLYQLLHGRVTMRDMFVHQDSFWKIIGAEDAADDVVEHCPIADIDCSVLPDDGAVFEILTQEIAAYAHKIEQLFMANAQVTQLDLGEFALDMDESGNNVAWEVSADSTVKLQDTCSQVMDVDACQYNAFNVNSCLAAVYAA